MSNPANSQLHSVPAYQDLPLRLLKRLLVAIFTVGFAVASASAIGGVADAAADESELKVVANITFEDITGSARSLATFRGRVVLLNIWATRCRPCRQEMPALDRLQSKLGGLDFEVVALSIDQRGIETIKTFFNHFRILKLAVYNDPYAVSKSALAVFDIPTTLLIDREGREVKRWVGRIEWDRPEIGSLISARLSANPREQKKP